MSAVKSKPNDARKPEAQPKATPAPAAKAAVSLLALHRHAGIVGDLLPTAGQEVEQRRLAAVGHAQQRDVEVEFTRDGCVHQVTSPSAPSITITDSTSRRRSAKQVKLVSTTSGAYYGKGYQDVQNRVPKISNTCEELKWKPRVNMQTALKHVFDAYRTHVADAQRLMD